MQLFNHSATVRQIYECLTNKIIISVLVELQGVYKMQHFNHSATVRQING